MLKSVVHFPSLQSLSGNPYWSMLGDALTQRGRQCCDSEAAFGRRWLIRNLRKVDILHFHYVQQFQAYEGTQARLRWVLRFASNLLLARLLGYRTVFTVHNATPTYPLEPRWVDRLGHSAAVNLTQSVIVHCEAARQLANDESGRHEYVYIVSHPRFVDQHENRITLGDLDQGGGRVRSSAPMPYRSFDSAECTSGCCSGRFISAKSR